ncbi:hypothetical protein [Microbacterium trichothecenolyticum]|uniref:Uncharacterized protein n=1 Tax=Microbacterium trichothecenolyticum TaxID=69370 RepID=A0A0M2HBS8_MICTR|nr:hypothetical protein [Microbacterium trichothecenolyticum]KJL41657.1 hypothetical protein RS82_02887 [Microbacterium trichothecenolyticum]
MKHTGTAAFLVASVVGAVPVFGLTLLIYATFFQDLLAGFSELTPEVVEMISRDQINIVAIVIANLAHGILLATVITWGRFYTPPRGAGAAAIVAFLTEAPSHCGHAPHSANAQRQPGLRSEHVTRRARITPKVGQLHETHVRADGGI